MNSSTRASVFWVALGFYVAFLFLWTVSHALSDLHTTRYALYFDWETTIAFRGWALSLYFSLDLAVILFPFVFCSMRDALPPVGTLLAQTAIAVPFFVFIPLDVGFQNDMQTGIWGTYFFDPLGLENMSQWNHIPSLHVAYAYTIAWVIGRRYGAIQTCIGLVWATSVSISTMLVHEHHLICILSGFALFLITILTIHRWLHKWYVVHLQ